MSRPARILSTAVMVVALALAVVVFVVDLMSDDPSSTAVLVFAPALIFGASVVGIVAVADYIVQQLRRR